jgi:hypothetical protein
MRSKARLMRTVPAGLGMSAAALTAMLLVAGPAVAGLPAARGAAPSGSTLVEALRHQTLSALTTNANRILRWVQCPSIRNGSL